MNRNKEHRPNGAATEGGRPIGGAAEGGASVFFVSVHLLMDIPYIFHIYFLNMFRIVFLGCFLNYGAKSSFEHVQMTSVGQISHDSGPQLGF